MGKKSRRQRVKESPKTLWFLLACEWSWGGRTDVKSYGEALTSLAPLFHWSSWPYPEHTHIKVKCMQGSSEPENRRLPWHQKTAGRVPLDTAGPKWGRLTCDPLYLVALLFHALDAWPWEEGCLWHLSDPHPSLRQQCLLCFLDRACRGRKGCCQSSSRLLAF